ncbi:translesion DNA synthesis-associated protein ImuA [Sessilibacter sp. MAH2]
MSTIIYDTSSEQSAINGSNDLLEQLLRRKDVWRGAAVTQGRVISSKHKALDKLLINGGWPVSELIDVGQKANGHGEWQLIAPALASLSHKTGLILLFNPPAMPFAPGLSQLGIRCDSIRVVRIQSHHKKAQAISALLDILQARCCTSVVAWEGKLNWRYAELRKLQLAASQSQALCFCFRKQRPAQVQSPAPLRITAAFSVEGLLVHITKQRGQQRPQQCVLARPNLWAPKHHQLKPKTTTDSSAQTSKQLAKVLHFNRGSLALTPLNTHFPQNSGQ